jgi:hypothetical protein
MAKIIESTKKMYECYASFDDKGEFLAGTIEWDFKDNRWLFIPCALLPLTHPELELIYKKMKDLIYGID